MFAIMLCLHATERTQSTRRTPCFQFLKHLECSLWSHLSALIPRCPFFSRHIQQSEDCTAGALEDDPFPNTARHIPNMPK